MKKFLSLFVISMFTFSLIAQNWTTVKVTAPGKLSTQIIDQWTNLKLTGSIDARDVKYMRDNLTKLTAIDLSAVTFVAYTGKEGTYGPVSTVYPANEMPKFSFFDSYGSGGGSKTSLTTIILPNSITSIGMHAFNGCSGLTGTLTIPSSVVSIGGYAFYNCSGLTGSLVIPDSITSIESNTFNLCQGLTSIVIPNSVTSIDFNALSNCRGLTSVISYLKVPVVLAALTDVFIGINKSTCTLYVPIGSKSLYKAAYQWKDFTNIVEMTTAVPKINIEKTTIYPNPVTENFQINGFEGNAIMLLTDINGKILIEKTIQELDFFSLKKFPKGIYFVKLNTSKGIIEKKVVRN